ncbi:MAG: hypothetical protein ACI9EK_002058 [Psychroserpens sp.]|jgi:hypothetical protein
MSITAVIKSATLITLDVEDDFGKKARFLYGSVVSDSLQRFSEGHWFLSSLIVDVVGDKVETRNNIYRIKEALDSIKLTLEEFRYVQHGHEPAIAKKLAHQNPSKLYIDSQYHLSKKNKKELNEFLSFLNDRFIGE